jgi:hypothetical protein
VTPTSPTPETASIVVGSTLVTSGQPSAPQNLDVGENEIVILVFAGSASTYTVGVTREESDEPPTLTIETGTNAVTISWTPDPTGWMLQETSSLTNNWIGSASGRANPITLPATEDTMFYRVIGP